MRDAKVCSAKESNLFWKSRKKTNSFDKSDYFFETKNFQKKGGCTCIESENQSAALCDDCLCAADQFIGELLHFILRANVISVLDIQANAVLFSIPMKIDIDI